MGEFRCWKCGVFHSTKDDRDKCSCAERSEPAAASVPRCSVCDEPFTNRLPECAGCYRAVYFELLRALGVEPAMSEETHAAALERLAASVPHAAASVALLEKLIALANDPDDRLNPDEYDTIIAAFTALSRSRPIKLGQKWVTRVTSSDGPDVSVVGPAASVPLPTAASGGTQEFTAAEVAANANALQRFQDATFNDLSRSIAMLHAYARLLSPSPAPTGAEGRKEQ
jgi:hypothetical protein